MQPTIQTLNAFLMSYLVDLKAVEAAPVMEKAFAADRVDISVQGDWEDVQIRLGLLDERLTPAPDYHLLPEPVRFARTPGCRNNRPRPRSSGRRSRQQSVAGRTSEEQNESSRKKRAKNSGNGSSASCRFEADSGMWPQRATKLRKGGRENDARIARSAV